MNAARPSFSSPFSSLPSFSLPAALGLALLAGAAQFRSENKEKGREILRQILAEAPATYEAHYALKWLEEG